MPAEPFFPTLFDSTMLSAAGSCHHLFFREYVEHWKGKEPSVHLHAGAAFAAGLEAARTAFYVDQQPADLAEARGVGALLEYYGDFQCPVDSAKSLERTAGALEFYFDNYPLGKDGADPITLANGKRGIEISFAEALPLAHPVTGDPLLYCGRLDMCAKFANGIFIEDDKTTSQLGASWSRQWDLRSQFTGYKWGLKQGFRIDAQGVLVRGVSILKTKYETQQAITYRHDWQVEEWFQKTCDLIEDLLRAWKRSYWRKSLDHSCNNYGGCSHKQPCLSQAPLNYYEPFFQQRLWNPVTREETLLEPTS